MSTRTLTSTKRRANSPPKPAPDLLEETTSRLYRESKTALGLLGEILEPLSAVAASLGHNDAESRDMTARCAERAADAARKLAAGLELERARFLRDLENMASWANGMMSDVVHTATMAHDLETDHTDAREGMNWAMLSRHALDVLYQHQLLREMISASRSRPGSANDVLTGDVAKGAA